MDLKREVEELIEIKSQIESAVFQKYIVAKLREKQNALKVNFFSDSLKDSWRKGGRMEGINEFFDILKEIDIDFRNKKDELDEL